MSHYFISDCHLTPDQPETVNQFYQFIQQHQANMDSLTILGDFFEVWIGDDSLDDWSSAILSAVKNTGVDIKFIAGNRDFLLSAKLLLQFNIKLLPDNSVVTINNIDLLLAHGDQLCTGDIKYQEFRKLVRSELWQQDFLSKPLAERQTIVKALREQSKHAMQQKQKEIMDVNEDAVKKAFSYNNVKLIIHGHTHRENLHNYANNNYRLVMAAWHEGISYLKIDSDDDALHLLLKPSNKTINFSI